MSTERTRVRRAPSRGVYDRASIDEILDEGLVAHVGFVEDEQPYVIPMLYARVGDSVYIHGSSASRAIREMTDGIPVCLTVTLIDGLVFARSVFNHSMNYRSAVVIGTCRPVEGSDRRLAALRAFTDHLTPGRWDDVRPPNQQELKATRVLAMDLTECSAKCRVGPPKDNDDDYAWPVWAGVVPLRTVADPPVTDPLLEGDFEPAPGISGWAPTPSRRATDERDA
jgi:hypothetical protein